MTLKPYMGFSRAGGSVEGAVLIFAHNAREAKKVGWGSLVYDICDGEYTDFAVRLIRDGEYLFSDADPEKLKADQAHVIESPKSVCSNCELWGMGPLGRWRPMPRMPGRTGRHDEKLLENSIERSFDHDQKNDAASKGLRG